MKNIFKETLSEIQMHTEQKLQSMKMRKMRSQRKKYQNKNLAY